MSERYEFMINWAKDRVFRQIGIFDPPNIKHFMEYGWDVRPAPYRDLAMSVFDAAMVEEHYELSYQQLCNAFYRAFQEKGWVD